MGDAIVVGSGPNGLAAAITLARAGMAVTVLEAAATVGGGARTSQLTIPGVLHDHCSAVHPLGVGSPFMCSLDRDCPAEHRVRWRWPQVDLAHPLDGGSAGTLVRDLDATVAGLGPDGPAWRQVFEPMTRDFDKLAVELLRPIAHVPRHLVALTRYGRRALLPATRVATRWRTAEARGLYAGVAAHLMQPLDRPTSAGLGLMMIAAGHRYGWPVAEGGSQAITDALVATLRTYGGVIETGVRVSALEDLASVDVVMLDTAPGAAADILGDALPTRIARAYRRFEHGPGAFKIDLAIEGDLPWINPDCRRAGTVHLGGTLEEVVSTERQIHDGQMPDRPFVLIGQQYLADPSRSCEGLNPIWAYAHVPHGYDGDATEAILAQIERFAPGARNQVRSLQRRGPVELAEYNANYVGGDIITGANTPVQLMFRPRLAVNPYRTGLSNVYLCSAATPPGAGVHGMCGYNAARTALRHLRV